MNISHEGGSIITFPSPWPTEKKPEAEVEETDPHWLDYWRAREFAERGAAKEANSIEARRVHQQLAQAYARIVHREERRLARENTRAELEPREE